MCGIVGIVFHDRARPPAGGVVRRMCDAIRHRGPDDEGIHAAGTASIGMRRLSIIDLAGSNQPIYNEDRSTAIVYNGEIYNYKSIRDGLVARGHRFSTVGDTETVLHLYEETGERCVEQLRGMFGFAIWDESAETLFIARDRFGIKPMYVVENEHGIAFSSELKALVAAGLTSRELDWTAMDMYLQLGYITAPYSPFADVRKLEPGCTLLWQRGGSSRIRRYWDLPRETRKAPPDVEARVRDWLDDSVTAHLVADVPVAAFLSGGIDSSAIVASMALVGGGTPHVFTARFHGSGAEATDETGLAKLMADRYGATMTIVDIEPDIEKIFDRVVYALDEPHADESSIPSWHISEAVASQYKVALAGTGGDELFAGYRRHIGLLVGEQYRRTPGFLRKALSGAVEHLPEPKGGGLGVDRLKRFLRTQDGEPPDRFLSYFSRLDDEERRGLLAPVDVEVGAARRRFREAYELGGAPHGLSAGLYLDYKTYLPDDILSVGDRLSMAHSLEVRVPFVDHVLVEHAYPLPESVKIGPWQRKRLLRQAMRPRLPEAHFTAPKRGFVGPTAAWLRNELRPMLEEELAPDRMRRLGYFDPATISRFLGEHVSRQRNREGILWELLCFSSWHRQYVERPAAASGWLADEPRRAVSDAAGA